MRVVLCLVVAVLLVGCTPGGGSPTPTSSVVVPSLSVEPTVVSPSPEPTPEPATPSPSVFQSFPADLPTEDAVSAAIIAGWQEYIRVLEKFSADPLGFTDFTETQYVTTGQKSTGILDDIGMLREDRVRILGDFRYAQVQVGAPSALPSGVQSVEISYCVDRSQMRVVGYDGVEEPTDHLNPIYPEQATLEQQGDGTWRVAGVRNQQDQTC